MCGGLRWVPKENLKDYDLADYSLKDFQRLGWI